MANTTQKIAIEIAGKVASSFGKSVDQVNNKLESIGKMAKAAAKIAGAAFAAVKVKDFVSDAVDTYSGFEQAMAQTAATAGASEEDYKLMEKAALEAGKATTKTAEESAQALGYMALAGWDTKKSMDSLMPILRASEAYQTDLADTTNLVAGSLSAVGVAVNNTKDLEKYLDVMTMANNKSKQTASQLMEGLASAGLTLEDYGDSLENVSAIYGMLANREVVGSEAGTAMKAITVNLKKNVEDLKEIGVDVYDSQTGAFLGISKVLEQYNQKTKDMTQEQRDSIALTIAGKNHLGSFNKIMNGLNTTLQDGKTEWEALTTSLNSADGALYKMADQCTGTMKGAMERVNSAVDDLKINLVKQFAPYATKAIDKVALAIPEMTEKMSQAIEFARNNVKPAIEAVKGYISPIKPYIFDIIEYVKEIIDTGIQFVSGSVLPKIRPALDIVIQLVSGLAERIGPFIVNFTRGFKNIIIVAMQIVGSLLNKLQPVFRGVFGYLSETLVPKLISAFDFLAPKVLDTVNKINCAMQAVWGFLSPIIEKIVSAISFVMPLIENIVSNKIDTIISIIGHQIDIFRNIIDFITNVFTGNWSAAWQNVVNIFGGIFGILGDVIKRPLNNVIDAINFVTSKISGISFNVPDWVPGIGGKGFELSIPEIPHLAEGGIATRSTLAEIGEGSEPEAITPISKLADFINGYCNKPDEQQSIPSIKIEVNIQGNANQSDVQKALDISYDKFKRLYEKMVRENRRVSF